MCWWFEPSFALAQQSISINVEGKIYRADIFWTIRHNNLDYKGVTIYSFDRSLSATFDLAVHFKFKNDSIPQDNNLVWGFQFNQTGDILFPPANEKRSRSARQFQRFDMRSTGEASLTIIPKIWKKLAGGGFEPLNMGTPFTLGFKITDSGGAALVSNNPAVDNLNGPNAGSTPEQPLAGKDQEESRAYAAATTMSDSTEKIKALIDFVDKYAAERPASPLVATAIKNVPLGTSLPKNRGDGSITYTLDYAVNPVIDTAGVQGWKWELSEFAFGRYELKLQDLGDSVHSIRIADLGKNAPFNRPRELRPFDRISVQLIGQDREFFQLKVEGGVPPFIVFLSQDKIPRERYILTRTDTVWSLRKSDCRLCKTGKHTLEVYNSDFSTLLLRAQNSIQIFRVNYYFAGLLGVLVISLFILLFKPLRRAWRMYRYERQMSEIEAWEKKEPGKF
ncbi:MAG: hypothetical protein IPH12_08440 [Saprospirales bacterium]|nr:hypothetical protein [Saprospirales bacterium]MBK8920856.1 hypothetical protein [Saprospirales bacterium]